MDPLYGLPELADQQEPTYKSFVLKHDLVCKI